LEKSNQGSRGIPYYRKRLSEDSTKKKPPGKIKCSSVWDFVGQESFYDRINSRTDEMIKSGLVEEVKNI
jgi:tRNA A37 N6-isopentenylltransferase MiaA